MAKKKLLIAACVVGLFAAFLVYLYTQQIQDEKEQVLADPHQVVVAAADIPAGTPLEDEHVTTKDVPGQFLPANPLLATDVEIYRGQPLAVDIDAGSMILTSDFSVAEVATTLSARIPTGERAVTVPVDAISGVAGLLQPGDRVDLLGTFPVGQEDELIPEASGGQSIGYVTMSMLQNVTLLAVGDQIAGAAGEEGRRGGYSNVTLALTPEEAELMVIAQTRGELQLLLRHREDTEQVPVERRTLREVLEDLDVINQQRQVRVDEGPPPCRHDQRRDPRTGRCIDNIEIIR